MLVTRTATILFLTIIPSLQLANPRSVRRLGDRLEVRHLDALIVDRQLAVHPSQVGAAAAERPSDRLPHPFPNHRLLDGHRLDGAQPDDRLGVQAQQPV